MGKSCRTHKLGLLCQILTRQKLFWSIFLSSLTWYALDLSSPCSERSVLEVSLNLLQKQASAILKAVQRSFRFLVTDRNLVPSVCSGGYSSGYQCCRPPPPPEEGPKHGQQRMGWGGRRVSGGCPHDPPKVPWCHMPHGSTPRGDCAWPAPTLLCSVCNSCALGAWPRITFLD